MKSRRKKAAQMPETGVIWSLLASGLTPLAKKRPPNLVGDIMVARYNADGSIIYTSDCQSPCRTFAITRDYEILWSHEKMDARGMDYSTINNTVLVYQYARFPEEQRHRIIELDAESGKIIHVLEKTALGPIGNPVKVTGIGCVGYHPADHGKFWVVDNEHHCVYCADWQGKIHYRFGEYDVPGNDGAHLNYPICVSPSLIHHTGGIVVSDWANHRVLNCGLSSPNYAATLPFPFPYASFVNDSNCLAVFDGGNPPGGWYGIFLLSDSNQAVPRYHIPINTNFIVSHPAIPFRFLLSWDCSMYEIDYRTRIYQETPAAPPIQCWLFSEQEFRQGAVWGRKAPIPAGEVVNSPPVIDWLRPNKNFIIKATAAATIILEAARFVTPCYGNWDGGWEPVEEYGLEAGKAKSIQVVKPFGACRLSVKLFKEGHITGWVNLSH